MASAVDSRLAYARLSAVATASRLPTANRGSNNSYTTSWDTTANRIKYFDFCHTVRTFVGRNNLYVGWPDSDRQSDLCERIIGQSSYAVPLDVSFVIIGDANDHSFLTHRCKPGNQAGLRTAASRAVDDVIEVNTSVLL